MDATYSPFSSSFAELSTLDLAELRQVREGWFIEYKKEGVNAKALAKEVSAFANTYGGWLFIGVAEANKTDPVAEKFDGMPLEECHVIEQRLRQGAASNLSHAPYFSSRTLHGPCDEIGLSEGYGVVAVHVPSSIGAPHVHADGGIYRRVAEGSEPKREHDRYQIQQLFERAEEAEGRVRDWVRAEPEMSKGESESTFVRVLFHPDPNHSGMPSLGLSGAELIECLRSPSDAHLISWMPFDNIFFQPSGVVGRQAKGNRREALTLTIKIYWDLRMELIVPIPRIDQMEEGRLSSCISSYEHFRDAFKRIRGHAEPGYRLADLNYLSTLLISATGLYRYLLRKSGWDSGFCCKAQAINIWRVVPFLDTHFYMNWIEENGPPVPQNSNVTSPAGEALSSFQVFDHTPVDLEVDDKNKRLNVHSQACTDAIRIMSLILVSFGLPDIFYIHDTYDDQGDDNKGWFSEFVDSGNRSIEIYSR